MHKSRTSSLPRAASAIAHVLPVGEASHGMRALSGKYRWLFTAFELVHRLQRKTPVLLEIVQPD